MRHQSPYAEGVWHYVRHSALSTSATTLRHSANQSSECIHVARAEMYYMCTKWRIVVAEVK